MVVTWFTSRLIQRPHPCLWLQTCIAHAFTALMLTDHELQAYEHLHSYNATENLAAGGIAVVYVLMHMLS